MSGISQKTLGELAGGISINIFMDFEIETVSDVLSLVFKMDEQLDITFTGKKNKKGEYDPNSIALKFNNPAVSKKLAVWARTRDLVQKTVNARDEFDTEEEYMEEVADMIAMADEIKQHLVNDSMVVKKGTEGIVIKISN